MTRSDIFDSDLPVVEAIANGDRFAFQELTRRHGEWVRAVIFGVLGDAERIDDVAQQVWTNVWERIDRLRDLSRWRPWLYRMAYNAAIDAGRDVSRRRKAAEALSNGPCERVAPHAPGEELDRAEKVEQVTNAVKGLPALYREPFVLRHLQGWGYREISEVMGIPVDTVETRLVRARRMLREKLNGHI